MSLTRYRLLVAYHGARYHGWQLQKHCDTVQGQLVTALEMLCGEPVQVMGASRTDAGVHARGQVCAFDYDGKHDARTFYRALNRLTPFDISIRAVQAVESSYHPRHSSRGKIYEYALRWGFHRDPFVEDRAWHVGDSLDVARMSEAAPLLVGEHDFTSFRASGCDALSPTRRMFEVSVAAEGPGAARVRVVGSAFLKYMVRNIVGTLVEVGRGRKQPSWVGDVLAARDRTVAGPTAPPHGLMLQRIFYPGVVWPTAPPWSESQSKAV